MRTNLRNPIVRAAVASVFAFSAIGLSACGNTAGPEAGVDVENVQEQDTAGYDGVYDSGFFEKVNTYDGKTVTVSADVNEVLAPTAFTIAGTTDTTVDPLLIINAKENKQITPDLTVKVTGTVHTVFDLPYVENELGVDLDDEVYAEWDGKPYIQASSIDTSVSSDQ